MKKKNINVLIIEDNPADARLVVEMLKECSDLSFATSCAERIDKALEALTNGQFDAVLLDLNLPDSKGLDSLEKIATRKPDLPVVLLTGTDDEQIGLQAIQKNAADYLVKGKIDEHLLWRSIRYAIERKLAEEEIKNIAKFPAEDPYPVLRLAGDGTILYSNPSGQVLLRKWNCEIGHKAPTNWYNLVQRSLRSGRNLIEQVECEGRIFSFTIAPIRDGKYTNLYGRDITVQEQIKSVLRRSRDELDKRVKERTAELAQSVTALQEEIEHRKRAEQSLRERSRHLDAFFSHTITPLVILDKKFNFIRVNQAYADACQKDIAEFEGHNHFELYSHEENEQIFKRVVRAKTPYEASAKPFTYPDHPEWGVTYWDWALVPVLDDAGQVEFLIFALKDVTEREKAESRLRLTNALLGLFVEKTSRKEYLDSVIEQIRDWTGCRCVGIRLTDGDGYIPFESQTGFSEDFLAQENRLSLTSDVCLCIRAITQQHEPQDIPLATSKGSFHTGNTIEFVNKLTPKEKCLYRSVCVRHGFTSLAVIPVRYRDEILGTIHLADEQPNVVPLESVEVLEDVASLIGEAVHRFNVEESLRVNEKQLRINQQALRELSAELQLAEERERRRIAQDLHDSIAQILAFSSRELKTLQKSLSEPTASSLKEVVEQLGEAIRQTRTLSFDLSPSILYELGFEAAIEDLVERMGKERNLRCSFEACSSPKPLTDDVKILLYRSIRELLINSAKHADASRVKVSLLRSSTDVYVEIEDDGKGFDATDLTDGSRKAKGFGLFSIRERLNHIGGSMTIESAEGKGTKAVLVAPLNVGESTELGAGS